MAGIQVLDRQVDPTLQGANQTGQVIAESIRQRQAFELTKRELKLKAQSSEAEEQKAEFERQAKLVDMLEKIKESGGNPTMASAQLKVVSKAFYGGDDQKMFQDLGLVGQSMSENAKLLGPGPGEATQSQLRGAQAGQANATSRITNMGANQLQSSMSQDQGNAPRTGAMASGSFEPTSFNAGGLTMENASAKGRVAAAETQAREATSQNVKLAPLKKELDSYLSTFKDAVKETGKSKTGAEAAYRGVKGFLTAPFKEGSAVSSLDGMKEPAGLALGAYINQGRPTEKDAIAGEKLLPHYSLPTRTNNDRIANLKSLTKAAELGVSPADLYSTAARMVKTNEADQQFIEKALEEGHSQEEIDAFLDKRKR